MQGKHNESERTREHDRTTRMLLAIVALFLITELPQVSVPSTTTCVCVWGCLSACNAPCTTITDILLWLDHRHYRRYSALYTRDQSEGSGSRGH